MEAPENYSECYYRKIWHPDNGILHLQKNSYHWDDQIKKVKLASVCTSMIFDLIYKGTPYDLTAISM